MQLGHQEPMTLKTWTPFAPSEVQWTESPSSDSPEYAKGSPVHWAFGASVKPASDAEMRVPENGVE